MCQGVDDRDNALLLKCITLTASCLGTAGSSLCWGRGPALGGCPTCIQKYCQSSFRVRMGLVHAVSAQPWRRVGRPCLV